MSSGPPAQEVVFYEASSVVAQGRAFARFDAANHSSRTNDYSPFLLEARVCLVCLDGLNNFQANQRSTVNYVLPLDRSS